MPDRPTPQIDTPNLAPSLRQHLESVRPRFESLHGVVGITLNGGLARGYADERSEIDISLFLDADIFEEWSGGNAPISTGITFVEGQLYDITVDPIDSIDDEWSEAERWDRSYAEILYDPTETLQATFDEKLADAPDEGDVEGHLFECWWHFRLAGDCWRLRGDSVQAHYLLNHAVTSLLHALFAVNGEFIPHEKWVVHLSRTLDWTPDGWEDGLEELLSAESGSMDNFETRRASIEDFWTEVDEHAREVFDPDLDVWFMQRTFFHAAQRLVKEGTISSAEWDSEFGLGLLNQDPFSLIADLDGDVVRLDPDWAQLGDEGRLYEWHQEILDAIQ